MDEQHDPTRTALAPDPASVSTAPSPADAPTSFGRYRVERLLGKGGFGEVYLGHDDELDRAVAIKVPRRELMAKQEDIDSYLAEARILASLDHPNIVPVFDVGRTDAGSCFIVSKFIEGSDLAHKMRQERFPVLATMEIVATVAEALH